MTDIRDEAHLEHILESIEHLPDHFIYLKPDEKWHENYTVRQAVLHTLQTMSESCAKISPELQIIAPQVEWGKIRDFRNVLVHDYLGDLEYEIIDTVIAKHLPELYQNIKKLYEDHYAQ
jgi:uncharacterized protein with HEPN domain